jgi:hypothetical protein
MSKEQPAWPSGQAANQGVVFVENIYGSNSFPMAHKGLVMA